MILVIDISAIMITGLYYPASNCTALTKITTAFDRILLNMVGNEYDI
jgi:hypothetical protein